MAWITLVIVLMSTMAHAAWWQYETATLQVVGVFATQADSRPQTGTALLDVGATALPIPAGCTIGRKEWTLLSPGGVLPALVNPSLAFFRCRVVSSKAEVFALRDVLIINQIQANPGVINVAIMEVVEDRLCPAGDATAPCPTIHTGMNTLRSVYPTRAQFNNFLSDVLAISQDATTVNTTQCTANPGGPFC